MESLGVNYKRAMANNGQATLALVLLIGGIITLIGVSLVFLVGSFINSGYGFQSSSRAFAVASAGVDDAIMKLVRNKDFYAASPYDVPVGNYNASVTVAKDTPVSGKTTIVSTATVGAYKRKVQAIVAIDSYTGQVHLVSWEELAL